MISYNFKKMSFTIHYVGCEYKNRISKIVQKIVTIVDFNTFTAGDVHNW